MKKVDLRAGGFTLVEMALVLLILGVLTRAAIMPLAAAQAHRHIRATAHQLEMIRQSLVAYVVAFGALPCPLELGSQSSLSASTSVNQQASHSNAAQDCDIERGGLPASLLGISGRMDQQGALVDAWNQPYLYAVSLTNHTQRGDQSRADWMHAGEAALIGVPHLSADITICMKIQTGDCRGRDVRADQVAFLVLSHGRDSTTTGAQKENLDNDQVFLLQDESLVESERFDDQMVWATAADIMYWMLRMGWLP